ncbi:MAG: TonB-dependent receptor plug domain-containing protein [Deltaproteobacteria bacterium]|nr:TonB-dependent receptor plug domain-containing protein [Deltaproteobacteria bacterium]
MSSPSDEKKAAQKGEEYFLRLEKLPKRLEESPVIITVVDNEFIRDFGFRTLSELLRTTPGFDARTSSWLDTPATRGIGRASLLMIDGTPINSHLTNLFVSGFGLDLWPYKRVEIVSGPGGVLWGASSMLGVVNLITRDGADISGVRGRVEFGSFGHQRYSVMAGERWGDVSGMVAVNFLLRRGANVEIEDPTTDVASFGGSYAWLGQSGLTSNENDYSVETIAKLRYKHFALFARIPYSNFHYQTSTHGGVLAPQDNGARQSDDWLINLTYAQNFQTTGIGVLAKGFFYRNLLVFDQRLWSGSTLATNGSLIPNPQYPNGFGFFKDQGRAFRIGGIGEVSWTAKLGPLKNKLIAGSDLTVETINGAKVSQSDSDGLYSTFAPFIEDASTMVASGYAYDEITGFDRFAVAGGARYNYADSYQSRLLLSASAVARVWRKNYVKFSIAQGLRPPTMAHRFGLAPEAAPRGDYQWPDNTPFPMVPATSTAWQVEVNTQMLSDVGPIDKFFARGDLAVTSVSDIKVLEPALHDPGTSYWLPRLDRNILSAEARLDVLFKGGHRFWLSYGYTRVTDDLTGERVPQHGPRHTVSAGAYASIGKRLRLVARTSIDLEIYRSLLEQSAVSSTGGESVLDMAPNVYDVTLGVVARNIFRDLALSLFVYNLFDQKYSYYDHRTIPDFVTLGNRAGQPVAFTMPGINVLFSARMSLR